jgi:hypothetical protein
MRMAAVAALVAFGVTGLQGSTALACEGPPLTLRFAANHSDHIVLGVVRQPRGDTLYGAPVRYVIRVERVIKGGPLPGIWRVEPIQQSDCAGSVPVRRGDRVVLEHNPGGSAGIWKVNRDGTVVSSGRKDPPRTLEELLAAYARLGLPDTATAAVPPSGSPDVSLPAVAGVATFLLFMTRRRTLLLRRPR